MKKEYLIGPEVRMDVNKKGINFCSGNKNTAFYELWGDKEIFRFVIVKPTPNFYASKFVGRNHLLFLLIVEDNQLVGGFVFLNDSLLEQLQSIFPHLNDESLRQFEYLWANFVKDHYFYDLET